MYPGIELRLLWYAIAVADTLNFTHAADRVHTSQPSLSRQILKLERDIGVELFRRTKRWVELTPAGHRFVEEARKSVAHAERAVAAAKQIKSERRETYTIGYCAFIDLHFLSAIRRMKPIGTAHFVYRNALYAEIVAGLQAHEWEAAFMVVPVREADLVVVPLFREPLAAAIPATHPLTKKRELELSDLRDETIILAPKSFGPAFRDQLLAPLEEAGVHLPANHEAGNPHEALHLVGEGFGVTLGQQSVLESAKEDIAVRRIRGTSTLVETALVFHGENDSPILKTFVEAVRHTSDSYMSGRGRSLPISA